MSQGPDTAHGCAAVILLGLALLYGTAWVLGRM